MISFISLIDNQINNKEQNNYEKISHISLTIFGVLGFTHVQSWYEQTSGTTQQINSVFL